MFSQIRKCDAVTVEEEAGSQWHHVCFWDWKHERAGAEDPSAAAAAAAGHRYDTRIRLFTLLSPPALSFGLYSTFLAL